MGFQGAKGGVPFPRTAEEWQDKGMTAEQADHKMKQDVFGHDYQTDKSGAPIERGKGSAAQPTAQHQMAMHIANEARAARGLRTGYTPALEGAFDPRVQDEIDRAVAARVKEALAKAKKPKAKRAKKPTPAEAAA